MRKERHLHRFIDGQENENGIDRVRKVGRARRIEKSYIEKDRRRMGAFLR